MIDFHTHILPGIDDGSKDTETSLEMLRMMAEQGVDTVVATPHFLLKDTSPATFAKVASSICDNIVDEWNKSSYAAQYKLPEIRLGAEIYLNERLQLVEGIEALHYTGSDLILFEMPDTPQRDWMSLLIRSICNRSGVRPVIAHIERYMDYAAKGDLERIMEIPGVIFQFNVSSIEEKKSAKLLIQLLKEGFTVLFGSDCHTINRRRPNMKDHMPQIEKLICKKLGAEEYNALMNRQIALLNGE